MSKLCSSNRPAWALARSTSHFGAESIHRQWLNTEGLPEDRTDEYQPVVDRWMKAVGKLPD